MDIAYPFSSHRCVCLAIVLVGELRNAREFSSSEKTTRNNSVLKTADAGNTARQRRTHRQQRAEISRHERAHYQTAFVSNGRRSCSARMMRCLHNTKRISSPARTGAGVTVFRSLRESGEVAGPITIKDPLATVVSGHADGGTKKKQITMRKRRGRTLKWAPGNIGGVTAAIRLVTFHAQDDKQVTKMKLNIRRARASRTTIGSRRQ